MFYFSNAIYTLWCFPIKSSLKDLPIIICWWQLNLKNTTTPAHRTPLPTKHYTGPSGLVLFSLRTWCWLSKSCEAQSFTWWWSLANPSISSSTVIISRSLCKLLLCTKGHSRISSTSLVIIFSWIGVNMTVKYSASKSIFGLLTLAQSLYFLSTRVRISIG